MNPQPSGADPIEAWIAAGDPRRERPAGIKTVWDEAHAERLRAHAKHRETSMESQPAESLDRLFILVEEIGEVAELFLDARFGPLDNRDHLVSLLRRIVGVGLVAHRLNDQRHDGAAPWPTLPKVDAPSLRKELIQVTAMAGAWAAAVPNGEANG